jgi:hypothetical protein
MFTILAFESYRKRHRMRAQLVTCRDHLAIKKRRVLESDRYKELNGDDVDENGLNVAEEVGLRLLVRAFGRAPSSRVSDENSDGDGASKCSLVMGDGDGDCDGDCNGDCNGVGASGLDGSMTVTSVGDVAVNTSYSPAAVTKSTPTIVPATPKSLASVASDLESPSSISGRDHDHDHGHGHDGGDNTWRQVHDARPHGYYGREDRAATDHYPAVDAARKVDSIINR